MAWIFGKSFGFIRKCIYLLIKTNLKLFFSLKLGEVNCEANSLCIYVEWKKTGIITKIHPLKLGEVDSEANPPRVLLHFNHHLIVLTAG